jgi:ABC-type transport system involved in cytochrome c biogenesis ATPase subunit
MFCAPRSVVESGTTGYRALRSGAAEDRNPSIPDKARRRRISKTSVMLEVASLACRRGDRRLFSQLSFNVAEQTLLHVRGRNGSGKTTLLRALCGLLRADAGSIRWRGEDIHALAEEFNRELLYFGHLNGIKADLTGLENLRIAATLDQRPGER